MRARRRHPRVRELLEDRAAREPLEELRLAEVVELGARLDLLRLDVVEHRLEQLGRQVGAVVDPAVVAHEFLLLHLVLNLGRVGVGVEHDHREAEDVRRVGVGEHAVVLLAVLGGELAHDAVDLLRLARQPEGREEGAHRLHEGHPAKVEEGNVVAEHRHLELAALAQVVADPPLREPLGVAEEVGDVARLAAEHAGVQQVLDAAFGFSLKRCTPSCFSCSAPPAAASSSAAPCPPSASGGAWSRGRRRVGGGGPGQQLGRRASSLPPCIELLSDGVASDVPASTPHRRPPLRCSWEALKC